MSESFWDKVENLFAGKYDQPPERKLKHGGQKGRPGVDMKGRHYDTWIVGEQADTDPIQRTINWHVSCERCGATAVMVGVQLRKGRYRRCKCHGLPPRRGLV